MSEDRVLVRAIVAIAGGPPKGEIDWVPRSLYEAASKSGKLESVENLSSRLLPGSTEASIIARFDEAFPDGWTDGIDQRIEKWTDGVVDGILKEPVEGTTLKVESNVTRVDPDHPSVQ